MELDTRYRTSDGRVHLTLGQARSHAASQFADTLNTCVHHLQKTFDVRPVLLCLLANGEIEALLRWYVEQTASPTESSTGS